MKAAFMTLGCKVNLYETDRMKRALEEKGVEIVPFTEPADAYIINTCTVTNIADRKSRKMINRAKRKDGHPAVIACGCYVNAVERENAEIAGIDALISNEEKDKAADLIIAAVEKKRSYTPADQEAEYDKPENDQEDFDFDEISSRVRVDLEVQTGCNQFCSYCIIPFVRGTLKSRDTSDIIKEAEYFARHGVKELVITGIHLSSFGIDREYAPGQKIDADAFLSLHGGPLLELVEGISRIEGIERIRFGSLEPRIITDQFVKRLSEVTQVCPHFHLSLQSGSDTVLARMNRHYDTGKYAEAVAVLRKYFDDPAITTDIIVGFPGETDDEFRETCAFVERIGFADVHVFRYSRRLGTAADKLPDQIDEKIKEERSHILIELKDRVKQAYEEKYIGRSVRVLAEENVTLEGAQLWTGYTPNYMKVVFNGLCQKNEFYDIIPNGRTDDNILISR
jgi:threonylcarbamoyladenosine tRNA methylthiotransferase MtaB